MGSKHLLTFSLLIILVVSVSCKLKYSDIFPYPGEYGYIDVQNSKGKGKMWYIFFEAEEDKENAPLIIWFSGGPGCAGTTHVFQGGGPFRMNDMTVIKNPYAWTKKANMLFMDNPLVAGYSLADDDMIPKGRQDATEIAVSFFTQWAELPQYQKYKNYETYIAGNSYGGRWTAYYGTELLKLNLFDIKGMIIFNAVIDAGVRNKHQAIWGKDYRETTKKTDDVYAKLLEIGYLCDHLQADGYFPGLPRVRWETCGIIADTLAKGADGKYMFNSAHPRLPIPHYRFSELLNREDIKELFGVPADKEYDVCRREIVIGFGKAEMFQERISKYYEAFLQQGKKVTYVYGDDDLIAPWKFGLEMTHTFNWYGKKQFAAQTLKKDKDGESKSYNELAFVRVYDGAHNVPLSNPKYAQKLVFEFIGRPD